MTAPTWTGPPGSDPAAPAKGALFAHVPEVLVVPPRVEGAANPREALMLGELRQGLLRARHDLAVDLGAPIRLVEADPGVGARWLIGPTRHNGYLHRYGGPAARPCLRYLSGPGVLVVDAPDLDGIHEGIDLLRTMVGTGSTCLWSAYCAGVDEAVRRIEDEVGRSHPYAVVSPTGPDPAQPSARGLDWAATCACHREAVLSAADPHASIQVWLARLGDAHTRLRPRRPAMPAPYQVWAGPDGARLARVPAGTAAFDVGVRTGALLVDVDSAAWWAQTGAAAHARALVAGMRLMASEPGQRREFVAVCPDGVRRRWVEEYAVPEPSAGVSWHRLPSGAGYLRIDSFRLGQGQEDCFDTALRELRGGPGLVVDLRGNLGGATATAFNLRDRFLRRPTRLGSVRVTTAAGELAAPYDLVAEPAGRPWAGAVRFLTDPLTYSASEDVLLGLKGLDHVMVIGERSGGGSGHTRTLRLLPEADLVVSTALTFGRDGWCLDGVGVPVDLEVTVDTSTSDETDAVLIAADMSW